MAVTLTVIIILQNAIFWDKLVKVFSVVLNNYTILIYLNNQGSQFRLFSFDFAGEMGAYHFHHSTNINSRGHRPVGTGNRKPTKVHGNLPRFLWRLDVVVINETVIGLSRHNLASEMTLKIINIFTVKITCRAF